MKKHKCKVIVSMLTVLTMSISFMPIRAVIADSTSQFVKSTGDKIGSSLSRNESYKNNSESSKDLFYNQYSKISNNENNTNSDDNTDFKLVKVESRSEKKDTDQDGISDSRELMIGTNPKSKDSNGNGINDVDEVYNTNIGVEGYEKDPNIDVSISCNIKGENVDNLILTNMEGAHPYIKKDIPGYIGAPFRVGLYNENGTQEAKIIFKVNTEVTKGADVELYVYSKDRQVLEKVQDGIIKNNNKEIILSTTLTHEYKEYVVLKKDEWNNAWEKEICSPDTKLEKEKDIALVIDKPTVGLNSDLIKTNCIQFVNSISGENKEAVVNFDVNNSITQGLTGDKNSLVAAIENLDSKSQKRIGLKSGLKYAIKALVPEMELSEEVATKSIDMKKSVEDTDAKNFDDENLKAEVENDIHSKDIEENRKQDNALEENTKDSIKNVDNKVNVHEETEDKVSNDNPKDSSKDVKNKEQLNLKDNKVKHNKGTKDNQSKKKNNKVDKKDAKVDSSPDIPRVFVKYKNIPKANADVERNIILFSDRKSNIGINDPTIIYAKNNGIKIFTVDLGNKSNENTLKMIAKETGGEYFDSEHIESEQKLLNDLAKKSEDLITDNDGDGIPNYYEENLRLINGIVLKLDPNNADTDGDGISDGVELKGQENELINCYDRDIKAFRFKSRPDLVDTDFDGIKDGQDVDVNKKNITTTTLLKFSDISYQELKNQYIGNKVKEIQGKLGNSYYNGNISREDIDKWNIIDLDNGKGYTAGFGALAVVDGRNLIVAYPGTGMDVGDLIADISILLGKENGQMSLAKDFIVKVLKKLKGKIDNVFVTGHSLGGYLTQYAVYQCVENNLEDKTLTRDIQMKGVTFNSARFSSGKVLEIKDKKVKDENIFGDNGRYKDIITDYRIKWDPVSSSINGYNIGKTVELEDKVRWDMPGLGPHYIYNFYEHFS